MAKLETWFSSKVSMSSSLVLSRLWPVLACSSWSNSISFQFTWLSSWLGWRMVRSPRGRGASSPWPSPCTPCPQCCAPDKSHLDHFTPLLGQMDIKLAFELRWAFQCINIYLYTQPPIAHQMGILRVGNMGNMIICSYGQYVGQSSKPHPQSYGDWDWAGRKAVCRRSWWIEPGVNSLIVMMVTTGSYYVVKLKNDI